MTLPHPSMDCAISCTMRVAMAGQGRVLLSLRLSCTLHVVLVVSRLSLLIVVYSVTGLSTDYHTCPETALAPPTVSMSDTLSIDGDLWMGWVTEGLSGGWQCQVGRVISC